MPNIEIREVDAGCSDASDLMSLLDKEIAVRDPGGVIFGIDVEEFRAAGGFFVIAYSDGVAAACGSYRPIAESMAEIKRMFVRDEYRGKGLARAIVVFLEKTAKQNGFPVMRVETGEMLHEAMNLYQSSGYETIPKYGPYVDNPLSHCYEKKL